MEHKIERTIVGFDSVEVKLASGVVVTLSSNKGYVHVSFSGIGINPIEVQEKAANYLNIAYKKPD